MDVSFLLPGILFPLFAGPAYELIQLENADFRDWTPVELRDRVGTDATLIPAYRCDGISENRLFTPALRPNPNGDSLRVHAPGNDRFPREVAEALAYLATTEPGQHLIRELENSPYPITIEPGRNSFVPRLEGGKNYSGLARAQIFQTFVTLRAPDYPQWPTNGVGSGGRASFDPNADSSAVESDGILRPTPAFVVLAHELYHAYDAIRGLLDRRHVSSQEIQGTEVAEVRASYFENQVRRAAGLRYKKYYGGDPHPTGPSLLDPAGEPIPLPAPCLIELPRELDEFL